MGPLAFEPLWATTAIELGVLPFGLDPVPWLLIVIIIAVGSFFMELKPVLFLLFNKLMHD